MSHDLDLDRSTPVPRALLCGHAPAVAPLLLNSLLVVGDRAGRIVEVEAYGGRDDPASHAHRGPTPRSSTMFAPGGTLYCYRSYGIHTCANVVTGPNGEGEAVLLRAVEPVWGLEAMWEARPGARREPDLANGPGKLCQALAITLAHDGVDLCGAGSPIRLFTDDTAPPPRPGVGPRIGITRAADRRWRFWVRSSAHVSR